MRCAWQEFLNVIPPWMRQAVDEQGSQTLQELRLRLEQPVEMVLPCGSRWIHRKVTQEDLNFVVNTASRYSPWAAATVAQGYLTAQGGHRIGLCGDAVMQGVVMTGIRNPTSLCLRVARDFPGIGDKAGGLRGSILILGKPGSGKTTLLRDLIRQRSDMGPGSVAVVDERGELFPSGCFSTGCRTDILTGCGKAQGIDAALRTMGPGCIAVDEITAEGDCKALIKAGWCGVTLLATAHAADKQDLFTRPVYRSLVNSRLFANLLILQSDKSYRAERMER